MNEYAANDNGLRSLPGQGATARTVEISSILQKSEGTYQVRWVETTFSNGVRHSRDDYTGLFQVKLMPPRDEADTFKNPIGVYITNFTWSREFSGPVLRDDRAGAPLAPRPGTPGVTNAPSSTNSTSQQGAMP
jgi:type IV secretion system protein VirB5